MNPTTKQRIRKAKSAKATRGNGYRLLIALAGVVIAGCASLMGCSNWDDNGVYARYSQPDIARASESDPRLPQNWAQISVVHDFSENLDSHAQFIQEIVDNATAVVIKGSRIPASVRRWGIEHFEKHCSAQDRLNEVKVLRPGGAFLHYDPNNKAMIRQGFESAQTTHRDRYYTLSQADTGRLWTALRSTRRDDIVAAVGPEHENATLGVTVALNRFCDGVLSEDLRKDLAWWNHFVHHDQEKYKTLSPATRNLWMGTPGVVTSWHFDTYTNFFVHLQGTKRVLVLPPSAFDDLYFYPSLHPFYRKSQIVWEDLERFSTQEMGQMFPGWNRHVIQAITLEAGDILYLPPFWNHRVETLGRESSVSLSFWSSSEESMLAVRLLNRLKREIDASFNPSQGLDFFQGVIHRVVQRTFPDTARRQRFFDNLVARQYLRSIGRARFEGIKCMECEAPMSSESQPADRSASLLSSKIDDVAGKLLAELGVVSPDIRPIVLGFVIEKGINRIFFEDVGMDVCFITECLAQHLVQK